MTSASPDFSFFTPTPVINLKTGKTYTLDKITVLTDDEQTLSDIVRACNEPATYELLFREKCKNNPYRTDHARLFLDWGRKGWDENSYFVFVLRDKQGRVAGAMDIRSNDLASSEVGYWVSSAHSGIMTPALGALNKIAAQAGYVSFIAYTRTHNERSRQVLLKNGFEQEPGEVFRPGRPQPRHLFRKEL